MHERPACLLLIFWPPMHGQESTTGERHSAVFATIATALVGCAYVLASSAGDALFLARVGVGHFGNVFALSSAVLIVVLALS